MDPAQTPHESHESHQTVSAPPVVSSRPSRFKGMLSRTSGAFTAEYSLFLIALGITLSNLAGLVYVFFGLIVDTVNGGAMSSLMPTSMFVLWLIVSSAVAVPLAVMLWSRVQGELANNNEYKGELPKGAAKGFRTFWIIVSGLSILGLVMAALYAPIAAWVNGVNGGMLLLSVTLPSLINVVILASGIYLVTRGVHQRGKSRLLVWIVIALTAVLFVADYVWAINMKTIIPPSHTTTPRTTVPSYTSPTTNPYSNTYDNSYYEYDDPNSLYR